MVYFHDYHCQLDGLMRWRVSLVYFFPVVIITEACIPTQQVETTTTTSTTPSTTTATTTTTSTTTTTTATTTTSTTTTTTTMTTTTTVLTEAPFPCTGCAKIYDTACQGFGIPSIFDWCPQAAEVGVTYFLGAVAALPFLPQNSCSTTIVCPPGTTTRINLFGSSIPAPTPATLAYCEETGPNAGKWYTGAPPFSFELSSLTCQNIASG
ncbi:hypothetical protein L5515_017984 [Caenorhabditis briggsae]|nr:hypothetical protein L5515_017984 [Caenorhabditis briggsae]